MYSRRMVLATSRNRYLCRLIREMWPQLDATGAKLPVCGDVFAEDNLLSMAGRDSLMTCPDPLRAALRK